MGKANLKHEVVRPQLARAVRAIRKRAEEAAHNFVPGAEPDDPSKTLASLRIVIADSGTRLHGYTNIRRTAGADGDGTGFVVNNVTGEALLNYMLSPVKRVFEQYAGVDTYVMNMDKGIFMPQPKLFVQKSRTIALEKEMERQQVVPLAYNADGSVPVLVAFDQVLPPWLAVRANRVFYRHATDQLFRLIETHYRPPPGKRLILDALDMAATSPHTIDDWMRSDRLLCDDYAKSVIERTREALRRSGASAQSEDGADWRTTASRVVKELAHAGHIKSVPICIETGADGRTYEPVLLVNAANECGEADVGIMFWIDALQAQKEAHTLAGQRRLAGVIAPELTEYYTSATLNEHSAIASTTVPQPLTFEQRRQRAEELLRAQPELQLQADNPLVRAQISAAYAATPHSPCLHPNRALVLSTDTDFLSLLPVAYARMCYENAGDPQYCVDNAPMLSLSECSVTRLGWLQSADDFYKAAKKKRKIDDEDEPDDGGDDDDGPPVVAVAAAPPAQVYLAHEVYDIERMCHDLLQKFDLNKPEATPLARLHCILSYGVFCATCENDYIAGLYGVNRKQMFDAFVQIGGDLVRFDARMNTALLVPSQHTLYLKHCYYNSLMSKAGNKNKPKQPAEQTTYDEVAAIVARKYKRPEQHMPDDTRRALVYKRLQWWLVYASEAWRSIGALLDHSVWGWPEGTLDIMV